MYISTEQKWVRGNANELFGTVVYVHVELRLLMNNEPFMLSTIAHLVGKCISLFRAFIDLIYEHCDWFFPTLHKQLGESMGDSSRGQDFQAEKSSNHFLLIF